MKRFTPLMALLGIGACLSAVLPLQAQVQPRTAGPKSDAATAWDWGTATPESQGLSSTKLEAIWNDLKARQTSAFLIIRNDKIVFEGYTGKASRTTPQSTASLAKALVGGVSLMTAMTEERISPDDLASRYIPQWRTDPHKSIITIRELATHTSGLDDAEQGDLSHDQLTGWKGDFWKQLPPPRDPFTLARDDVPVVQQPGKMEVYSNPGMAMLSYCLTVSLLGSNTPDLRTLLKQRIMQPLGIPDSQWSCGYGKTFRVDGLPLVPDWGGAAYSPNAAARVGRLLLRQGDWNGTRLLDANVVRKATSNADVPNPSGLGWWVNLAGDGSKRWPSAPNDAFSGAGAGQQFLFVVPSLHLIVVRNGRNLNPNMDFNAALYRYIVNPIMQSITPSPTSK